MEDTEKELGRQVLGEIRAIGLARATDFMQIRDGVLDIRSTDQLPEGAAAAIASVEKTTTGLKLKFYDKLKALELLAKCLGLFDGSAQPAQDTGLLQAIIESTKEELDTYDISELQQAAAAGDDLVEPPGNEGL